MAQQYPPKKNDTAGYTFYVSLVSQANTKIFQANPTLASGDVLIALDDGAPANIDGAGPITNSIVVDADFTKRVKVILTQAQTNVDNITIIFSDAAGAEWCDLTLNLQTVSEREQALLPAALSSGGNMKADLVGINNVTTGITGFDRSTRAIGYGTCAGGGSTTSVISSAFTPAGIVTDQFKGRIIIFDNTTTTTALRGQATDITGSTISATPTFTVTALTTAPASGDTFVVM